MGIIMAISQLRKQKEGGEFPDVLKKQQSWDTTQGPAPSVGLCS